MNGKPQERSGLEQSFWLLPVEPLRLALASIIERLALDYDAVAFEPHVTISSGKFSDGESTAIARSVARSSAPVELAVAKLDHTSAYTKTLFIQYRESAPLRRLSAAISAMSAQPLSYILNPHLSLLYKAMPSERQAEICRTLNTPADGYVFDRLRVIETEIPLFRAEQIERWRTVYECGLGEAQTGGPQIC